MTYRIIYQLIERFGEDAFFVGKATQTQIKEIEQLLGVTLPNSYKTFLNEFGHGGVTGLEINGQGLGKVASCVEATLNWRKFQLPPNLVVIEDAGTDWIYCLDTSRMRDGECPVVDWEQNRGIGNQRFETFYDYFKTRLEESLNFV